MRYRAPLALACVAGALAGCQSSRGTSGTNAPPAALAFPADFRFGAATSAHQVEGGQTNNWTLWETLPPFAGRTAEPSGIAVDHYRRYAEDLDWARWMGLDAYRFSIEWSRIEPERGRYDAAEIAHYRDVLAAMRARGIRPSVTLHHFTDPLWFADLTKIRRLPANDDFCADGPSATDFCYWSNPAAPAAFGAFCALVAREFGGYVDEWWTFNELTGHWLNTAFTGDFPPGLAARNAGEIETVSLPVLRGMLAAHAACYEAIHAEDAVDADGDGRAARVGLTTGTGLVAPADATRAADVAAAEQAEFLASFLAFDAAAFGMLDADLDGVPEEAHPEWAGTLDLVGLQFYASTVILGIPVPPLLGLPCLNIEIDAGDPALSDALTNLVADLLLALGCPAAPTQDFPLGPEPPGRIYGRQSDPEGLGTMLDKMTARYAGIPIVITENGYADDDDKRASSLVRHLAAIHGALGRGDPVEGYYHWSLLDNFEWGRGFAARFGLLHVDYAAGLARSPTAAAEVYREITASRGLRQSHLDARGGPGPLPSAPLPRAAGDR